ncbi:MAG: hypothetical protein FJY67_02465 [Calditrichaeota bacterium]|nr:hypothetical protein [Calditrichota bacterium]
MPLGPGSVTFGADLKLTYDSNLLHYSDRDFDRFLDGTEPYPSTSIRSLDDLRTDFKMSAEYRIDWARRRTTRLRLTGNFGAHYSNPVKNLGWASFNLRQDIAAMLFAQAGYFYEPRYYIRDYLDSHTDSRRRCDFALSQWTGSLTWRPMWSYELTGTLRVKDYEYNRYFTEYDGRVIESGLGGVWRQGDWRFETGYSFAVHNNTGFSRGDRLPEVIESEDSELGNADFEEDGWNVSMRRSLLIFAYEGALELATDVARRVYTTDRSSFIDPIHSERIDRMGTVSLVGTLDYSPEVNLEAGLGRQWRSTEANDEQASRIKSFGRWTVWAGIGYRFE